MIVVDYLIEVDWEKPWKNVPISITEKQLEEALKMSDCLVSQFNAPEAG